MTQISDILTEPQQRRMLEKLGYTVEVAGNNRYGGLVAYQGKLPSVCVVGSYRLGHVFDKVFQPLFRSFLEEELSAAAKYSLRHPLEFGVKAEAESDEERRERVTAATAKFLGLLITHQPVSVAEFVDEILEAQTKRAHI